MAYPYYANPYAQPYQPYPPQAQVQQPTYQTSMIWVSGIEEVKMYPTAPNTVIPFYDNDGRTEYWKQTDASGRASIRVFDRIDRDSQQGGQKPAPELATKEDVAGLAASIQAIKDLLKGGTDNA